MKIVTHFCLDCLVCHAPKWWHRKVPKQIRRGWSLAVALLLSISACSTPAARAQTLATNLVTACGVPDTQFAPYGFLLNGSAHFDSTGTRLILTDGGPNEAGSVFCQYNYLDPTSFATSFTFQLTDPLADGFTFTLVGPGGLDALGGAGGGLGYKGLALPYSGSPSIASVAIKFDLFNDEGEGANSTGIYLNGASPTQPSISLAGTGIDLHSGDPIAATIAYVEPNLSLTLTDTLTQAVWAHSFTIDIPTALPGGIYGFGFTAGTGGMSATQQILKWTTAPIYYPAGLTSLSPLQYNGAAGVSTLKPPAPGISLAQGASFTSSSVFFVDPLNVSTFVTDFTFQMSSAVAGGFDPVAGGLADGMTFVIQNAKESFAGYGGVGGWLGYGIGNSVAIKFDLFDNSGEGANSTGIYTDGAFPGQPSINLAGTGIDLHSPDIFSAHITYDGTTLSLTLTDTVTGATWTHAFPIDIPAAVSGGPLQSGYAWVGFTASTGEYSSVIQLLSWTYWNP